MVFRNRNNSALVVHLLQPLPIEQLQPVAVELDDQPGLDEPAQDPRKGLAGEIEMAGQVPLERGQLDRAVVARFRFEQVRTIRPAASRSTTSSIRFTRWRTHNVRPVRSCRQSEWSCSKRRFSGTLGNSTQVVGAMASALAGQSKPPMAATSAKVLPGPTRCSTCSLPLGAVLNTRTSPLPTTYIPGHSCPCQKTISPLRNSQSLAIATRLSNAGCCTWENIRQLPRTSIIGRDNLPLLHANQPAGTSCLKGPRPTFAPVSGRIDPDQGTPLGWPLLYCLSGRPATRNGGAGGASRR